MAYVITEDEYLEINSVPLATPAWLLLDIDQMWNPADVRGTDLIIPGAVGVVALPRRKTVSNRSLTLVIFGDFTWEGTPVANVRVGLQNNLAHLKTNIVDPASGDGTRTAVLHLPSGATKTGPVHVEHFSVVGQTRSGLGATLDLSLPLGELA